MQSCIGVPNSIKIYRDHEKAILVNRIDLEYVLMMLECLEINFCSKNTLSNSKDKFDLMTKIVSGSEYNHFINLAHSKIHHGSKVRSVQRFLFPGCF
jgi:hypothetical protein